MKNPQIPVLGFAAYSGTGKTTLLTKLIPILNQAGYRVGLIKHSHHNFEIDKPGKDSYRLRQAGASQIILVSSHRRAIITEFEHIQEPVLAEQLDIYQQSNLDLILVEGFKSENFPKIELHRPSLQKPLLFPHDKNIIALATDSEISLNLQNTGLSESECKKISYPMQLDINHPQNIADFILNQFISSPHA